MDRIKRYRGIIHRLMEEYQQVYARQSDSGVDTATICDEAHGEYLLMRVGRRGETRVRRPVFYLRLRDGKIHIEED